MTGRPRPIPFIWTGREMVPLDRYRILCDRQFREGTEYSLIPHEEISDLSRRHYFATLRDCWMNLPESQAKRFPTEDHMRSWALVEAGYADEHITVCESREKAYEVAALCRSLSEYAVIAVSGNVVKVWTAKSQSRHAMGNSEFQKSKTAVLEIIAGLINVTPKKLAENAGKSA